MVDQVIFKFDLSQINLKRFFLKEIKRNIIGTVGQSAPSYKSLVYKHKQGILLDSAPSNALSTIRRKGRDHWMRDTGDLAKNGFGFWAKAHTMRVYASQKRHSGKSTYITKSGKKKIYKKKAPPTYYKLFSWHNAQGYSGVFQQLPKGSQFPKRLEKELLKQLKKALGRNVKHIRMAISG